MRRLFAEATRSLSPMKSIASGPFGIMSLSDRSMDMAGRLVHRQVRTHSDCPGGVDLLLLTYSGMHPSITKKTSKIVSNWCTYVIGF